MSAVLLCECDEQPTAFFVDYGGIEKAGVFQHFCFARFGMTMSPPEDLLGPVQ
ncbi:hypothetical protein RGR602_PB00143 (plasmid) [Rhizobium gallicum bv. gallicum R602sp]|uniref:Uncharacterized protein n=1 Tax=Rhizobium gallicum bv. gallicum R602sp TaxID=1041138 RepID=A0A0B4XAW2_9HYPH|nr:hypothetical protein RGR602_PB00143 [Rhizobium gallicum bv. gallicum R602sp]